MEVTATPYPAEMILPPPPGAAPLYPAGMILPPPPGAAPLYPAGMILPPPPGAAPLYPMGMILPRMTAAAHPHLAEAPLRTATARSIVPQRMKKMKKKLRSSQRL